LFKKRTLFIVGAGAGYEIGMPVGVNLATIIANKMDIKFNEWGYEQKSGDRELFSQVFRQYEREASEYQKAAWVIRDGIHLFNSIDDFLDIHAGNSHVKKLGKAAIVKSILEAERGCKLFVDTSNIYNKMSIGRITNTWFVKFARMLGRGIPLQNLEAIFDNVAFVVFNYDRCIEYFLQNALQELYSINEDRAAKILARLKIIHPYGQVGVLPNLSINRGGVAFGGGLPERNPSYFEISKAIKIYTEQINDEIELNEIRSEVEQASRIVFLGFAFHEQNVSLLKPTQGLLHKEIFATAFGMSNSDVSVVKNQLQSFFDDVGRMVFSDNTKFENQLTCSQLFDSYNRSLPA
jgi:hypothetical protein